MLMRQFAYPCMLLAVSLVSLPAQSAQAGPLLDWLFHKHDYSPAVPVGAPYPVTAGYAPVAAMPYASGYAPYATAYAPYSTAYAPTAAPYTTGYRGYSGYTPYGVAYPSTGYRPTIGNVPSQASYPLPTYGTYYGNTSPVVGAGGYGYLTQKPPNNVIAPAQPVLPPTNPVTLVPDYNSTYSRTPVTYYRPVLTTDPNTGSQVVTLAPCTSYEYQTQRVPTWGLTQVYNGGATLPAVTPTAPVVSPSISLPRGGIPLSGPVPSTQPYATAYGAYPTGTSTVTPLAPTTNSIITPASPGALSSPAPYTSGYPSYSSNYGNYSALQPGVALPPRSTYPTSPYYGNGIASGSSAGCTGGGSTGSYGLPPSTTYGASPYGSTTTPGTSLPSTTSPSAPSLSTPGFTTPSYPTTPGLSVPAPATPGTMPSYPAAPTQPVLPGNTPVFPPSSDPAANVTPNLGAFDSSRSDNKPQLQNFVQQPLPGSSRSFNPSPAPATTNESKLPVKTSEGLLPIPLPEDFKHVPRWNPGLLKEQDTTAAMPVPNDPQVAWGSKPIRWASHQTSTGKSAPDMKAPALPPARLRSMPPMTVPVTEIPEVNFQPPKPARLELEEEAKPEPTRDPKGRSTNLWK